MSRREMTHRKVTHDSQRTDLLEILERRHLVHIQKEHGKRA